MKGIFLKFLLSLFLLNVGSVGYRHQQSCSDHATFTMTKEQLLSGEHDEDLEKFFATHLKDISDKQIIINTAITSINPSDTPMNSVITTTQTIGSSAILYSSSTRPTAAKISPTPYDITLPDSKDTTTEFATNSGMTSISVSKSAPMICSVTKSTAHTPTLTDSGLSQMNNTISITDNYKANSAEGCFWIELIEKSATNRSRANRTCTSQGFVLAVIPDQISYDAIVEDARKKLNKSDVENWNSVALWLRMTYNSTTNNTSPDGAFNDTWLSDYPLAKSLFTGLLVTVSKSGWSGKQGLKNDVPSRKYGGVVCWNPNGTT